jgi:hypothetical protein
MAAPPPPPPWWAPVNAAAYKASDLFEGGQYARAAAKFVEAIAALEAVAPPRPRDCLVLAHLRSEHAAAVLQYAAECELGRVQEAELLRALLASLPAFLAAFGARLAAGTLLPGAQTAEEDAWYAAERAHIHRSLFPGTSAAAAAAATREQGRLLGYEACVRAANVTLATLTNDAFDDFAPLPAAERAARFGFVAASARMLAQPRTYCASEWLGSEAAFVFQLQELDASGALTGAPGDAALRGLRAAWRALQGSGQLRVRCLEEGVAAMHGTTEAQLAAAAAHAAARGGLRACAADGCGAREEYVSHFKLCSACKTVAYCGKAHQTEDWPAHKKACKAARKAAEQ